MISSGLTCLKPLLWRQNERDSVSNHQPHECLLNRLFGRRSKKTSKLRVTGLCSGNSPVTGEFPAQRAITRKMFPFDDVIMHRIFHVWIRSDIGGVRYRLLKFVMSDSDEKCFRFYHGFIHIAQSIYFTNHIFYQDSKSITRTLSILTLCVYLIIVFNSHVLVNLRY